MGKVVKIDKKNVSFASLALLLIVGGYYRLVGLFENYSFWSDEAHVALFVRAILERGRPVLENGYSTSFSQSFEYWLAGFFAQIFGLSEFWLRFPSVIFGVLTIWVVYKLSHELFGPGVAWPAAILTTFLKIEILWSRQARPYQALQFFYLLSAYFLYQLAKSEKFNWLFLSAFLLTGVVATLFHGLGLLIFLNGFLYFFLVNVRRPKAKKMLGFYGSTIAVFVAFAVVFSYLLVPFFAQFKLVNNFFYYRVFLSHNYLLFLLLAVVGFFFTLFGPERKGRILVIFLTVQMFIVSFFLPQPFTRYFYPVFPFLIILFAFGLENVVRFAPLLKRLSFGVLLMTFLIVAFDQKFSLLPARAYSLNADMQEIPEVDWNLVYRYVGERRAQNQTAVLLSNWNDLPVWHLGEGNLDYVVRESTDGKDPLSEAPIVGDLESFEKIIRDHGSGLFVLDSWDNRVPDGVREYARDYLKKEMEVDRLYEVQPRYWPVVVYSWGLD